MFIGVTGKRGRPKEAGEWSEGGINSTYKLIKGSIVAFVLKYVPVYNENAPPPVFPTILGTGFVVRENGIVATNAHVVRMFSKVWCPSDAPKIEWPITALMFKATERGILEIPLEVIAVAILSGFDPGEKLITAQRKVRIWHLFM